VNEESAYHNATEAVGLFHTAQDLQAAIDDLLAQGFDRADINLMASERAIEEKLHHAVVHVRDFEDQPGVPTAAYVSSETLGAATGGIIGTLIYIPALVGGIAVVSTGGPAAAAIAAAAINGGIGGAIGMYLSSFIGKAHAQRIEEHLEHGGLLLWVRTPNEAREQRAMAILTGHNATDVHLHVLPSLGKNKSAVPIAKAQLTDTASAGD